MNKREIEPGRIIQIQGGKYKGHGARFVRWEGAAEKRRAVVIIAGKVRKLGEAAIYGKC